MTLSIEKLFPIIMIGLSIIESAIYFVKGHPPHRFYWLTAAGLTTTTLFM